MINFITLKGLALVIIIAFIFWYLFFELMDYIFYTLELS